MNEYLNKYRKMELSELGTLGHISTFIVNECQKAGCTKVATHMIEADLGKPGGRANIYLCGEDMRDALAVEAEAKRKNTPAFICIEPDCKETVPEVRMPMLCQDHHAMMEDMIAAYEHTN